MRKPAAVLAGLFCLTLLAPTAHADDHYQIAEGDLLITNHSFEDGLDGWEVSDGRGGSAATACAEALSTAADGATDGDAALQLAAGQRCRQAGALSEPQPVQAGQHYSAWADVSGGTMNQIGLRWLDADGDQIDATHPRPQARTERLQVSALAPEAAASVQVELGSRGAATFDNVLITAQYTELGQQVNVRPSFISSAAGVDENGRHVVWAIGTGSADDPALLVGTDILTGEVTRVVRLPGATGSWAVSQNPVTGTVYVGTYGAGALWLYTPGEDEAVNAGKPDIPGWDFGYQIDFDAEGNAYGGGWGSANDGYPGASVYTFNEDEGFTGTLGDTPLVEGPDYTRAVGHDEVSRTTFVGAGTGAELLACGIDSNECENISDLISPDVMDSEWVYYMRAGGGYVMAWIGDGSSAGNDTLVVLQAERVDGDLQLEVVDEIAEVAFPGSSLVIDDHIYYIKANMPGQPLHSYNVLTGEETELDVATTFARRWDGVELEDPNWPGTTLVGWNSGGTLVKYNIETGETERGVVPELPEVALRINSLAQGPDGRIYSSGYLTGGVGIETPMRDDRQISYQLGGQAEHMISHQGRMYQGLYPGGTIASFIEGELADGTVPDVHCTIGAGQARPYGLYASDDRIYYGSAATDGHDGGAFGWYDMTDGECNTFDDPLEHESINAITGSAGKIFAGGSIFFHWNTAPIKDEATLLVYDESTDAISELELPVDGLRAISGIATADDGTVWLYAEGWLLALNPRTLQWLHTEEMFPDWKPGASIPGDYGRMLTGANGRIYGNMAGRVFSFDPQSALADGNAQEHTQILYERAAEHLALDDYGNVYVRFGATRLLRIDPTALEQE